MDHAISCGVCIIIAAVEGQECFAFSLLCYIALLGIPSWGFYVVRNDKIYLGFYINCPIFLFNFKSIWMSSICLHKRPNTKFHRNPSSCWVSCWYMRQRDRLTKVMGAFHYYVHSPKNKWYMYCIWLCMFHASSYNMYINQQDAQNSCH